MSTPRKLKTRRMWVDTVQANADSLLLCRRKKDAEFGSDVEASIKNTAVPAVIIPLDDVAGLVIAAAAAHYKAARATGKPTNGDCMRAALVAIGVLPEARKGRK